MGGKGKIVLLIRLQSEVGKKNQQESRIAAGQFEDPSPELTDWNLVKLSAVTLDQVAMSINVQFLEFHGKVSRINMDSNWSEQNIKCEEGRQPNLVFWPSGNGVPSGQPALSAV